MRSAFVGFLFSIIFAGLATGQVDEARVSYDSAAEAARAGDFSRSERLYIAALEKLPENAPTALRARILFNIGCSLYRQHRAAEAIPFYRKAFEVSSGKYTRPLYALGMAFVDTKEFKKASDTFEQYLHLEPADGEAWFDLGLVRLNTSEPMAAKIAFETAIKYGTIAKSDAINNIGIALASEGDVLGAISKFREAIKESNRQNSEATANLDTCLNFVNRTNVAGETDDFTRSLLMNRRVE